MFRNFAQGRYSRSTFFLPLVSLGLLGYALTFIASHYQPSPRPLDLLFDSAILLMCFAGIYTLCFRKIPEIFILLLSFVPIGLFLFGFIVLQLGWGMPYELLSHFGGGTLTVGGSILPFGDLSQLTSASTCDSPVSVGTIVCDPFLRDFNQNPHIVYILRFLNFTNLALIGTFSIILFYLLIAHHIRKYRVQNLFIPAIIASPVFFLAMERGNELITLVLILFGFELLRSDSKLLNFFGANFLLFASVFKLWPTVLCIVFFLLAPKGLSKFSRFWLLSPFVYWAWNHETAIASIEATQKGSPFGNSFGFKLFLHNSISPTQILLLIILTLSILVISFAKIRATSRVGDFRIFTDYDFALLSSVITTYLIILIIGDSFAYRLLVLLPAVLILSEPRFNNSKMALNLNCIFLLMVITIRLPITISITIGCSFSLAYFLLVMWGHRSWNMPQNSMHD